MGAVRRIGVATVARSDYGIYVPLLRRLAGDADLDHRLFVTGAHTVPEHGHTVDEIRGDGFRVQTTIEASLASDSPAAVAKTMGLITIGMGQALEEWRPDLLLVLGDRYEMLACASAAVPHNVPLVHLHGGEATEGLIDEQIRHAITKMAHLHFVATEHYAERVRALGEEPWRITTTGALSLDHFRETAIPSASEFADRFGVDLGVPTLLVTFHPLTLNYQRSEREACELLDALRGREEQILFTYPNADTGGRRIAALIEDFVASRERTFGFPSLGQRWYFCAMQHASTMVGNSSSGIIEAGSVPLPVVNIGDRQKGRLAGRNVVHADPDRRSIEAALRTCGSPEFLKSLEGMQNPYGDGSAGERMHEILRSIPVDDRLLFKRMS